MKTRNPIFYLQVASLMGIWILLSGIIYWLSNALIHAYEYGDIPAATTIITIVGMCVYSTLVAILTYVFVGLQRGRSAK